MKHRPMSLAERREYHREWMRRWRSNPHNRKEELSRQKENIRRSMERCMNPRFPKRDGDNYRYIGRVAGHGTLLQLIRWLA